MSRKAVSFLTGALAGACAALSLGILIGLVAVIVMRGWPALRWSFFTEPIRLVGAEGGVWWNIVGTLILIATAAILCLPMTIGLALTERVWLKKERSRRILRTLLYALNGLPSIVFGLFGFIVLVRWCGLGKSWLAGGGVLALMILPTVTIALIERIAAIPRRYSDAAAALGLRPSQIVWSVLLPQAWSGLITGLLLGLARAAGETAPLMFTATIFAGATWPRGIVESPVLSLPYHIFILAQDSFDPSVGGKLWGAALVLLGIVFLLSLVALPGRLKLHEEANG